MSSKLNNTHLNRIHSRILYEKILEYLISNLPSNYIYSLGVIEKGDFSKSRAHSELNGANTIIPSLYGFGVYSLKILILIHLSVWFKILEREVK